VPTDAAEQVKRRATYEVVYLSDPERAEEEKAAKKATPKSAPS
jgi:hypothetical protein